MKRATLTKRRKDSRHEATKEWPAVVYLWTFGLAIGGYAVGRVVLDGKPHPLHWLVAIMSALAGIPLGWLWYRWRGDVF